MSAVEKNCLYIVATPIGNLGDISHRAVEILSGVDAIAAEDTRHSRRLLQYLGIDTPLFAFHEHNESAQADKVISRLQCGEAIALVSDAGTPLVSDPGYILVRNATQAGIKVIPVPGASSILAALSCSGLPTDRFVFEGFLPGKSAARRKKLEELMDESRTLVFFEAPHRIEQCLGDLADIFGDQRQGVLARELTKTYETFLYGSLGELLNRVAEDSNQSRGEIVLVVQGVTERREIDAEAGRILNLLMDDGLPLKQASSLAAKITGLAKKTLYQAGLERKKTSS